MIMMWICLLAVVLSVLKLFDCSHLISLLELCPLNKKIWQERDNLCGAKVTGEKYHCLFVNRTNLGEVCMKERGIMAGHGCPYLDINKDPLFSTDFRFFPCKTEEIGCPANVTSLFLSTELYEYPPCIKGTLLSTRSQETTHQFGSRGLQDATSGFTWVHSPKTEQRIVTIQNMHSTVSEERRNEEQNLEMYGIYMNYIIAGFIFLVVIILGNIICLVTCFKMRRKTKDSMRTYLEIQNQIQDNNEEAMEQVYHDIEDIESRHSESDESYLEPRPVLQRTSENNDLENNETMNDSYKQDDGDYQKITTKEVTMSFKEEGRISTEND